MQGRIVNDLPSRIYRIFLVIFRGMSSPRQYKSSRLQERQAKEAEDARIYRRNMIVNFWNHIYDHTTVCIKSEENSRKRIKVDVINSQERFEYSIYPDLIPFELPMENEDYSLSNDFIDEVMNVKQRVRRVGGSINVPYYKKLKRNYYYNLDPDIPRCIIKDEDIPTCSCRSQSGCDDNCQNRICYMECPPNYCPSLLCSNGNTSKRHSFINEVSVISDTSDSDSDSSNSGDENEVNNGRNQQMYCNNTVIQRKKYPKTEVFATEGRGYGLRLCDDVGANTILIEYLGEVITVAEGVERMSNYAPSDDLYFAALGGGLMLDAGPMGSTARFANHSCDPSCELQRWNVKGENRLVLVSKAAMVKGSEITYNYKYFEDGLEKHMDSVTRQKCLCGATRCAGTIGGKIVVSELDQWHTKAQFMLNGSKRYSLDQFQTHLDRGTSVDTPEYQAIQDVIRQGEEWIKKYVFYFATYVDNAPFTESKGAKIINHGLPEAFVVSLLQEVPKNLKLEEAQRVEEMIKKCAKLEKVVRSIMASSSSNGSPRVEWKYLLFLMNELYSVLPISVNGAYDLLNLYQSWSVWTVKLLRNILCKRSYIDGDIGLEDTDRRKPFDITRLRHTLRIYGVEKIISIEGLRYAALFENRVSSYMERYGMQTGVGLVQKGDSIDVDIDKLLKICMSNTDFRSLNPDGCKAEVNCFCQTTDELSEIKVFVECNDCAKWYHLPCVNSTEGAAKSKAFTCPLCLHKQNIISNFVWKSNTEWKFGDYDVKASPVKSMPTAPKIEYALPPPSVVHNVISVGSLPKSKSSLLTPQDLESAVIEAQTKVMVSDNPVEFLCTICNKCTGQWMDKVKTFFAEINIQNYFQEPITMWSNVAAETLQEEALVMTKALHLYYELRVLRIYPDELVLLRKLVWVITARCVSRHYDDEFNQIPLQDLREIVASGAHLLCSDTSIWSCLNGLYQRCLDILNRCNSISITDDHPCHLLEEVNDEINSINNYVHLTREYPVAKYKSALLARSKSRHPEDSSDEMHCWCRTPASECMICCEKCEEWFHIACVGISTMTKAKKIDKFYCITCTDIGAYPYQWQSVVDK